MIRRSKRASLSLSVEAIVILVLAITMLGLGISFTKGIFDQFKIKYDLPLSVPTDNEPIVMPPGDELKIANTGQTMIPIRFKNIGSAPINVRPNIECDFGNNGDTLGAGENLDLVGKISGIKALINPGDTKDFQLIVAPGTSGLAGTVGQNYPCRIVLEDTSLTTPFRVERPFTASIVS